MATLLDEFVGLLSWKVDEEGPKKFEKQKTSIVGGLAKIGAAYTAISGLVTGLVAHTNVQTAAQYRLAKGLGLSFETLDKYRNSLSSSLGGIEGIGTAIQFLSRSVGNANAGSTEAAKAFKRLGLSAQELAKTDAGTRFETVIRALMSITDETERASIAQKIFGRAGGVPMALLGTRLKNEGKNFDEYLNRFEAFDINTEQSAKGALAFAERLAGLRIFVDSAKEAFSGLIGEALSPMMEDMTAWIAQNRELIKIKLKEWAASAANWLKSFWKTIKDIGAAIYPVIKSVGGLTGVFKLLTIAWTAAKFANMTKNVGELTLGLGKLKDLGPALKRFFTGPAGIAGLAGVAMYAISDLIDSIDDISNDSWGNRIARQLLAWSDQLTLTVAKDFFGAVFKNQADQDLYLAKLQQGRDRLFDSFLYFPKQIASAFSAAMSSAGLLFDMINNKIKGLVSFALNNPVIRWIMKMTSGGNLGMQGVNGYLGGALAGAGAGGGTVPFRDYGPPVPTVRPSTTSTSNRYFNSSVNVTAPVTINAAPGMDEKEIGRQVNKHLEKAVKRAVDNLESK